MSNFSETQSRLKEIAARTSGELTSVEVITYVEALSRSTAKDYTVKPSAVNSTLTVSLIYVFIFFKAVTVGSITVTFRSKRGRESMFDTFPKLKPTALFSWAETSGRSQQPGGEGRAGCVEQDERGASGTHHHQAAARRRTKRSDAGQELQKADRGGNQG